MPLLPYWRLSGFYFFYFSLVGAFSPYWSLYLQSLEFNALQIGVLMSLSLIVRIFSPSIWGWLADHTGKRIRVVQIAALCGFLCFCTNWRSRPASIAVRWDAWQRRARWPASVGTVTVPPGKWPASRARCPSCPTPAMPTPG
mgnify:CR=1 FL=1